MKKMIITIISVLFASCTDQKKVEEKDDKDFCSYLNVANIDKTIPFVDDFLSGLSANIDGEQKLQELAEWLRSQPCIVDAAVLAEAGKIALSFDENGITNQFIMEVSMTNPWKVAGYLEFVPEEEDFCSFLNVENIDKTIPFVDDFLSGLSANIDGEQKLQELAEWLRLQPCIVDAAVLAEAGKIALTFDENGITNQFIMEVSMTNPWKVAGYLEFVPEEKEVFYYYYEGRKIFLNQITNRIGIRFPYSLDVSEEQKLAILNSDASLWVSWTSGFMNSVGFYAALDSKNGLPIPSLTIQSFREMPEVVSAEHLYQNFNGGKYHILLGYFGVKLKVSSHFEQLQKLAEQNDCTIEEDQYRSDRFDIYVSKNSKLNAMHLSCLFYETGHFESSSPKFYTLDASY